MATAAAAAVGNDVPSDIRTELDDLKRRMAALEALQPTVHSIARVSPWTEAYCDGCHKTYPQIGGPRYKCSVCEDMDFCKVCIEKVMRVPLTEVSVGARRCKDHVMLRMDHLGQAHGKRRVNKNVAYVSPAPVGPVASAPLAPVRPAPSLQFPSAGFSNPGRLHYCPGLGNSGAPLNTGAPLNSGAPLNTGAPLTSLNTHMAHLGATTISASAQASAPSIVQSSGMLGQRLQ